MPELRKDPIIGRWVIISTERKNKPTDFVAEPEKRRGGFCPFCEGNEYTTPPEVLVFSEKGHEDRKPNTPGWKVRVVPNKFPALKIEGKRNPTGLGMYDLMNGIGAHEVIIEDPSHEAQLADMSVKRVEDVLWAYKYRTDDLKKDTRFRYIMIFKNWGSAAGASLEHTHSQLIATPIVPKRVMEELQWSEQHFNFKERCIFCDIIRQEQRDEIRVVTENEDFISLEPFAPRFPFETWILPKKHQSHFEKTEENLFKPLAEILKETLMRLNQTLSNPPYNFIIHTTPANSPFLSYYHWHIEIMPKLTKVAGFEWGTGFYINPTPPEEAAKYLREVNLDSE